ncbi:hypothetical protein [Halobaculum rarum]|uniref:hypothetical protein n=1 Tax=Halobaculum rarum TaxID=3075122 RepID=UPI0032AEDD73
MSTTVKRGGILAVRFVLVSVGVGVFALAVRGFLTILSAAADGEGFVSGGALLLWSALAILSMGVAGFGIALPSMIGNSDPSKTGSHPRRVLKTGSLVLVVGGVAFVTSVFANAFFGMLFSLLVVLSGVLVVCLGIAWSLAKFLDSDDRSVGGFS